MFILLLILDSSVFFHLNKEPERIIVLELRSAEIAKIQL